MVPRSPLSSASIAIAVVTAARLLGWQEAMAGPIDKAASIRKATKSVSPTVAMTFDASCEPGQRAVIAAVGDLLFHDALQAQALKSGATFRQFWAPIARVLADADITYGNLESPIASGVKSGGRLAADPGRVLDRVVYGKQADALVFNTHPSVAVDLVQSGFKVVSTANNHAADRGALGIDRTLDALAAAGLAATGTRRSGDTTSPWSVRTHATGMTVAWLSCTYGLNGMPDRKRQVLNCYADKDIVFAELRALAADPEVDAVMLTPHWGSEGSPTPLASDRRYAREAVEAGATAVIGTHPHVLQPWEKVRTNDGREGLVIYSTGNFISNQPSDAQRSSVIALLEVTKPQGRPARLSAVGFVPTFVEMKNSRGHRVVEHAPGHQALARTLKTLPAANRVTASQMRDLPRACAPSLQPVAPPTTTAPPLIAALPLATSPPRPSAPVPPPRSPDMNERATATRAPSQKPEPPPPPRKPDPVQAVIRVRLGNYQQANWS
jgi:poly-gamma-glutamate capsule biosynthesis protein CapA/YwtB (metallophosphatase superfamily)